MTLKVATDLNNLVRIVCSEREIEEDKCKVVMGVDGTRKNDSDSFLILNGDI